MSERNQLDVPKPTTTRPLPAEGLLANAAKRVFRVTAIPLRNHPSPLLPINRRSALDCLYWRNGQKWGLKGGPKRDSQHRCADGDYFAPLPADCPPPGEQSQQCKDGSHQASGRDASGGPHHNYEGTEHHAGVLAHGRGAVANASVPATLLGLCRPRRSSDWSTTIGRTSAV